MPAQFINRIADLERFWEVSAVPLSFLPFLVYVYSRPPSQVIIFHCYSNNVLHLQGFILWTLARFFVLLLLLLISRLNITFLFEKQLTAFNNEESANIAWHSLKIIYFHGLLSFTCHIYNFANIQIRFSTISLLLHISQDILLRALSTVCILAFFHKFYNKLTTM